MPSTVSRAMASASMIALASAHGFILSPEPRMPGDAFSANCGQQMYYNQEGDNYGNVQGQMQVAGDDLDPAACNVWLCKGYQFDDNTANVQEYSVGQEVDFSVDIRAPHTGVANVSVVSTSTNTILGSVMKSWDNYASNSEGIPEDQEKFSVTIPDVGSDCSSPGDCVIQWFWDAPDIDQTYESCVDIVVGGSSGGSAPSTGGSASNGTSGSASSSVAPINNVASSAAAEFSTASSSSAPAATTAASGSSDEEADPTCEVAYVTVTPEARKHKHKRHARQH